MKKIEVPLDASAKAVLERAVAESARLNHEYVGTEHLALALLRFNPGIATSMLQDLGVDAEKLRAAIESAVPPAAPRTEGEHSRPFTTRAQHVYALAQESAVALGETALGAEHLLAGLVQEPGIGGQILSQHGVTADAVLAALRQ
jgi:ATP-dependent Clp protease ATP-binding subunit ClpC